jgi:hypothetical protein
MARHCTTARLGRPLAPQTGGSMQELHEITPPRIGTGTGYFVAGSVLLALGMFAALAASGGGGPSAVGVATFCLPLAAGLIAVGFWVSLFGKLERRLIDLQGALQQRDRTPTPAAPAVYKDNPEFGKF